MNKTEDTQGLGRLVSKLKKEDTNYSRILKSVQIVYGLLIPVMIVLTIRDYMDSKIMAELISGICFVMGLFMIVIGFRKLYKEYKYVDYSLPVLQMLKKAIKRYTPFQKGTSGVYIGVLLIDVGLTVERMDSKTIWETQIFFLGAVGIGAVIGLIWWYFQYKPLQDEAKRLLREIES